MTRWTSSTCTKKSPRTWIWGQPSHTGRKLLRPGRPKNLPNHPNFCSPTQPSINRPLSFFVLGWVETTKWTFFSCCNRKHSLNKLQSFFLSDILTGLNCYPSIPLHEIDWQHLFLLKRRGGVVVAWRWSGGGVEVEWWWWRTPTPTRLINPETPNEYNAI